MIDFRAFCLNEEKRGGGLRVESARDRHGTFRRRCGACVNFQLAADTLMGLAILSTRQPDQPATAKLMSLRRMFLSATTNPPPTKEWV